MMVLMKSNKIPVTILTDYLGAGKTTLLNRILTEKHNQKITVIVNEYGKVGIDNQLVVDADEEILEMNNGCICCTVGFNSYPANSYVFHGSRKSKV